jgi:hypothetical protein
MTIMEILSLDFEPCNIDELLALMDIPGYFEVSNYYKLFNYLPLDENKIVLEDFFPCYKFEIHSKNILERYTYYKLYYGSDVLFVCKLYMGSLSVALLDRAVYNNALGYLVSSLDLFLLETKNLSEEL